MNKGSDFVRSVFRRLPTPAPAEARQVDRDVSRRHGSLTALRIHLHETRMLTIHVPDADAGSSTRGSMISTSDSKSTSSPVRNDQS